MPITARRSGTSEMTGYYYVKGERIPLEREPNVYAVRLRGNVREDSAALSPSARQTLREDSEAVGFIPNYGLRIMRLSRARDAEVPSNRTPDHVSKLNDEDVVDFAAAAFRREPRSEELMFTTRRFVVQFKPDMPRERIEEANARYGVQLVEQVGYMNNGYVLEAPSGEGPSGPVALANAYFEDGLAVSSTPDFVRQIHFRRSATTASRQPAAAAAAAPVSARAGEYLARQWHLATAKVIEAWDVTVGSPSITIAVLDDGIDVDHPEFAGKVKNQADFETHVSDARPKYGTDNHGTACAGVAVALGAKAHGAAPGCSLMAVRTPGYLGVADEAKMFQWACDEGADVISCSWGPADGTGATDPLPDNVRAAIHYCVTDGRQGKGIPIVWAAGNGDESVSLDGYAANPDVMAIGASTSSETRAPYSDYGPEIWVCAPSSGSGMQGHKRVFTTDRHGSDGYNGGNATAGDSAGDYTNDFGGTSSATPLVAGIIGLILSVRPELTHQQIRDILRSTTERIGDPAGYDAAGHSPQFGFGRVDARRAVDAAAIRQDGGHAPPAPATTPWIIGPAQLSRSGPAPVFTIGTAGEPLYAVEIATGWQQFAGGEHTPDTFYASWAARPLLTDPTFTLPDDAWQRMRGADRLYYRLHTTQDTNWTGWQVSTADSDAADAPYLELTGAVSDALTPAPATGLPTITGPQRISRDDPPPEFTVDKGTGTYYAVEIAARWQLFEGGAPDSGRGEDVYFASWNYRRLLSDPTYQLPEENWRQLRANDRLYYRVHTATATDWTGWQVSTPDVDAATAPFVEVSAAHTRAAGNRDKRDVANDRPVTFPSATFTPEPAPDDGIDYADPVTGGSVPLIEVRDRLFDRLSPNFTIRELAARRVNLRGEFAGYARISPELVTALQSIRDLLARPITVTACYRYPALNAAVGGAAHSQHMTGRAADIRVAGLAPLELARAVLHVLGPDIGLGLGSSILHVDLRGEPASWVYQGAELSEAEFDAWVRTVTGPERVQRPRQDSWDRSRPTIGGPASASVSSPPPSFTVATGPFAYYSVEVATDWQLFTADTLPERTDPALAYASWSDTGMRTCGRADTTTYTLPETVWRRLAPAGRLYYRVLAADQPDIRHETLSSSLPRGAAAEAPSFPVSRDTARRAPESRLLDSTVTRRLDEARWRTEKAGGADAARRR